MLTARLYKAETDLQQMYRLLTEADSSSIHPGDLQLRLSDPSVNFKESLRVWEDNGQLVGFAFLHLNCSEFIFESETFCDKRSEVEAQAVEWALRQAEKIAAEGGRYTIFYANVPEFAVERMSLLENYGFTRDEKYRIYLDYPLNAEIPAAEFPPGFTAGYLKSASEVQDYIAAYHNAFLFDKMTEQWRRNLLGMPDYIPELDLVAAAPNGEFAAFCLCWLEQEGSDYSGIKKGYIQTVGTQQKFQNKGIGKVLFLTALQRLQTLGAQIAVGDTEGDNAFALRLYESAGVRRCHKIHCYFLGILLKDESKKF